MTKELLQQALDALENGKRVRNFEGGTKYQPDLEDAVITALREAIAAPQPKPVAWLKTMYSGNRPMLEVDHSKPPKADSIPVYAAPPAAPAPAVREPLPEPVQRLMRFAGKKRSEVSNPCLTAREAIAIADWMQAHGIGGGK